MSRRRCGVSFVEVLIGMVFMTLVAFSILDINRSSQQASQDVYYKFLALQLAKEPITLFRAYGYQWLEAYEKGRAISGFPLNEKKPIDLTAGGAKYPAEAANFERRISLARETRSIGNGQELRGFRVRVEVTPAGNSFIQQWLRRDVIALEAFVMEQK